MKRKSFKKYQFYVWLANFIILLVLIILMILGLFYSSFNYIFLSEGFTIKYLGFLGLDKPLILYIIPIGLIVIWANLEVFYKDKAKYKKEMGIKDNPKKNRILKRRFFYFFISTTLFNIMVEIYLIYNKLFLDKFSQGLYENIMIIGFVFLPINIALLIISWLSKN